MAVSGLALIGLALPLPHGVEPVVACTAMALLTACMTLYEIVWATVLQERVPDDKLGRVSSINQLAGYGLWPLGFVLAGALADLVSPAMVFLGAGTGEREHVLAGSWVADRCHCCRCRGAWDLCDQCTKKDASHAE